MGSTAKPAASVTLPPDELAALQHAVKEYGSQKAVADALGVSGSVVNNALRDRYFGDVPAMVQRIRGALMKETHHCPVLGEISVKVCLDEQRRPLVFTNPLRVQLHRACKRCEHRRDVSTTAAPKGGSHA